MAAVGQRIVYRLATSDYRTARITEVVSGTTVDLVAFSNGTAWGDGDPASLASKLYTGIDQGIGVGTWQESTEVDPAVSSEIDADVSAEASARAAAVSSEASTRASADAELASDIAALEAAAAGYCAVPAAGSSVSLALNTARQPPATRPVLVAVSGTWAWSLSALGSQSGTATLQSDANSTPTTARPSATCARGISVGITIGDTGTMPWSLTYIVPPGDYYQVATAGTGTFAITHIEEQVL